MGSQLELLRVSQSSSSGDIFGGKTGHRILSIFKYIYIYVYIYIYIYHVFGAFKAGDSTIWPWKTMEMEINKTAILWGMKQWISTEDGDGTFAPQVMILSPTVAIMAVPPNGWFINVKIMGKSHCCSCLLHLHLQLWVLTPLISMGFIRSVNDFSEYL